MCSISSRRQLAGVACVCLLSACTGLQTGEDERLPHGGSRHAREINLQRAWRGASYDALLQNLGTPVLTMEIPGRSETLTFAAVYGVRDRATMCIDAFTIVVTLPDRRRVVVDYFCR